MLPILTRRQRTMLFGQPTPIKEPSLPSAEISSDSRVSSPGEVDYLHKSLGSYKGPKISNKRELPIDYLYVRYKGDITVALCSRRNAVTKHEAGEILAYYLDVFPYHLSDNYPGPNREDFKDVFAPKFDRKKTIIWLHFHSFFKASLRSGWCENRNFVLKGYGKCFSCTLYNLDEDPQRSSDSGLRTFYFHQVRELIKRPQVSQKNPLKPG
jgi:hypothetical protein